MTIKFLQGGAFVPPYAVYLPLINPQPELKTLESKSSKKESPKENMKVVESILNSLKDLKGLPGDIATASNSILSIIGNILNNAENNNITGHVFNTTAIAADYLKAINLVKNILFLKELYDKSLDTAIKNGGLTEVAINSNGHVLVSSKEGLKWKSPEIIAKYPKKYIPITNAQLLDLRALGIGGLAFNNEVLTTVSNSVGIKDVNKLITDAIDGLGTRSTTLNSYISVLANKLLKGLNDYTEALQKSGLHNASAEDLYKVKLLNESQYDSAMAALAYIYAVLPNNAKTLLKMKSDKTNKGALDLISNLITSKISIKTDFDPTLKYGVDLKRDSSDSEGVKDDFVSQVQAGRGGHLGEFDLRLIDPDNPGPSTGIKVNSTIYEGVKNTKGGHQGVSSVDETLNESGLRHIINGSIGVYFGDQKVELEDLAKIEYPGKGIARVTLPIDTVTGAPNFKIIKLWNEALTEYKNTEGTLQDKLEVFKLDKYKELQYLLLNNGNINSEYLGNFILMDGMTTDNLIGVNTEGNNKNKFVEHIEYDPKLIEELKNALSTGEGKNRREPDIDTKGIISSIFGSWLDDYDEIYKGTLFIPIIMNKNAANIGSNQKLDVSKSKNLELEYLQSRKNYNGINPEILIRN